MRVINGKKIYGPPVSLNDTVWLHKLGKKAYLKKLRKMKRHHGGEQLTLKVTLPQTKHRMRIIKLQPAVKVGSLNGAHCFGDN